MQDQQAEQGTLRGLELVIMIKLCIPVFFFFFASPGETEHKAGFQSIDFRI